MYEFRERVKREKMDMMLGFEFEINMVDFDEKFIKMEDFIDEKFFDFKDEVVE